MVAAGDRLAGAARGGDQVGVERDRLDPPERLPLDAALLGRGRLVGQRARLGQQGGEHVGVEVPLIEQQRGLAGDRRDDARLWSRPRRSWTCRRGGWPHRALRARSAPRRGTSRAGASSASSRRARPGRGRSRGCARRRPCRAPCRPAGRGPRARAPARCAAPGRRARRAAGAGPPTRGRGRRRAPRDASSSRMPFASRRSRTASGSSVPATAEEPNRLRPKRAPSSSAQSTSVTVQGGVPCAASARSVSSARHDAERAVQPAAVRHRVDVRADHDGLGPRAREARPEVAGLVDLDLDRQLGEALAQQRRARSPTRPSSTAAARRPGRRSARPARADRRSRARADRRSPRAQSAKRGMMCSP